MSHDHIPIKIIIKDIADTQLEIVTMTREEKGFRIVGDRWSLMKADSRKSGIVKRKEFIVKLEKILKEREKT